MALAFVVLLEQLVSGFTKAMAEPRLPGRAKCSAGLAVSSFVFTAHSKTCRTTKNEFRTVLGRRPLASSRFTHACTSP